MEVEDSTVPAQEGGIVIEDGNSTIVEQVA